MERRTSFLHSAILAVASALACPAHALDGAYDPSFGDGGRTWIDVSASTTDQGYKLLPLAGGNFFMGGQCGGKACAAWLTAAGAKASGYGPAGTGTALFTDFIAWPDDADFIRGAAAFPDGRIALIVGRTGGGAYLVLLRANGTGLDPAIGNGAGYVTVPFTARRVAVTPQQQVIVVGATPTAPLGFNTARYDSNFHLDTTFGTGGSTAIGFPSLDAFPYGIALQKDGKIVVVGYAADSMGVPSVAIVRLQSGGLPDPDFGADADGRYLSKLGNADGASAFQIVEDAQGRLVYVGSARVDGGTGTKWLVNRILGGGAGDASFNNGHPQQFTIGGTSTTSGPQASAVAVQRDGRIVVTGTLTRPLGGDTYGWYFGMARFTDLGYLDSDWEGTGQSYGDMSTQSPFVTTDVVTSLVVVPGGVVIGGYSTVVSDESRFVATKMQIELLFGNGFER